MNDQDVDWYGPDAATFGDRVAAARDAMDMTQSQLARRMGVKKSTIVAWEQDVSEPRANKLSMMAGLLNVSIKWLLTGEGEGLETPGEEDTPGDLRDALHELRAIRGEMRTMAERAARLEKKLRLIVNGLA
jgi:transcriptional regulator with XRE-family HTH domain